MGIRDLFATAGALPRLAGTYVPPLDIGTPWGSEHPHHLESVVWADVAGRDTMPATRAEAMAVPALARARSLIVTTIAGLPIQVVRGDQPLSPQPNWVDRTARQQSPFQRMLRTADDLLFYGASLWALNRGTDNQVLDAIHVAAGRWTIDNDGYVLVDDHPMPANAVALIEGIHEGILSFGSRTIRHASHLTRAADKVAEVPTAFLELHQTTSGAPMTDTDIDQLTARWAAARKGANGGVAYTNAAIEVKEHGAPSEHLLIEGRNAAAIDIARLCGIPASLIDAVQSGTSVTYQNAQARIAELITFGVSPVMQAICARLGQDDICPRGQSVRFDLTAANSQLPTAITVPDDREGTTE